MDSVLTVDKGIEFYNQLNEFWDRDEMHARKGLSNSETVSKAIPLAPFTIRTKVLL